MKTDLPKTSDVVLYSKLKLVRTADFTMSSLPPVINPGMQQNNSTPWQDQDVGLQPPSNRSKNVRRTPTPPGSRKPSVIRKTSETILEEPVQQDHRPSIVSDISRFSIDSEEEMDNTVPVNAVSLDDPLSSPAIREEAFSTPRSQSFSTTSPTATGRRRASAISSSSSTSVPHNSRKSSVTRPHPMEFPLKSYPANEGTLLQSPRPPSDVDRIRPYSPATSSMQAVKSPPPSAAGTERTITTDHARSINTDTTSEKAEKGLQHPFIPKFLRTTTKNDQITPAGSRDSSAHPDPDSREPTMFESDADAPSIVDVTYSEAVPNKNVGRPRIVQRFSNRILGLREFLDHGPDNAAEVSRMNSVKRQGVIGLPETQEGDDDVVTPRGTGLLSPEEPPKAASGFFPQGLIDGLRSNPVTRTMMGKAPEVHSSRGSVMSNSEATKQLNLARPEKRVTFPLPLRLVENRDHEDEERRQSIVSTPYPIGYKGSKWGGKQRQGRNRSGPMDDVQDILTVAVYTSASTVPRVRRMILPRSSERLFYDHSYEKAPPTMARQINNIDDEKLFMAVKSEYRAIRGFWRTKFGPLTVRTVRLAEFENLQELVVLAASPPMLSQVSFGSHGQTLWEEALLQLFANPKRGRKQHVWTRWVSSLPGNSARRNPTAQFAVPAPANPATEADGAEDKIETISTTDDTPTAPILSQTPKSYALILEEGLAPSRIAFAIFTVMVLSVVAALLWVFLGLTGQSGAYSSTVGPAGDPTLNTTGIVESGKMKETGFRDAGSRVQSGMVLGMGMLLMGLSGVGGWIGVGYLAR